MKQVYGFVLHFGYVEAAYASQLLVHHGEDGFDTLEAGLASLGEFLARNFLEGAKRQIEHWERYEKDKPKRQRRPEPDEPTLDEFSGFLQEMAISRASEHPTFDPEQLETWWPWDSVQNQAPFLSYYWENLHEPAERILPRFVNIEALLPDFGRFEEFFAELRELQTKPPSEDEHAREWWERKGNAQKQFARVLPTEAELTAEVVRLRTAMGEILARSLLRAVGNNDAMDRATIATIAEGALGESEAPDEDDGEDDDAYAPVAGVDDFDNAVTADPVALAAMDEAEDRLAEARDAEFERERENRIAVRTMACDAEHAPMMLGRSLINHLHPIYVKYVNHRGEHRRRHIRPEQVWFGTSEWHGETPQWFLRVFDLEKEAYRDFALTQITWEPKPT